MWERPGSRRDTIVVNSSMATGTDRAGDSIMTITGIATGGGILTATAITMTIGGIIAGIKDGTIIGVR
jgi:hypothetical protein